ncbi:8-amino-7-oxononanoate synthase [Halorhodospira halochloris]|uniref:8-amino-7-oxononanoate synthase n=1 Tax=Halorhodospira halochloris TaxID=1052 RepID=A0A0X8X6F6_HALHR|nr:8-amino-7-oxononanoate synthase [Halorhodospira halochloris]BAU56434.1 8-amino-7-oxononanoate synthase [Halorhodospira halochloris]
MIDSTADAVTRLDARLQPWLQSRRDGGLWRQVEPLYGYDGARASTSAGRSIRVMCGNDYLGLATDPRLAQAMIGYAGRSGVGTGAAHLVTGHRREHAELEGALAEFTGREAALLFSTGYMANLGVISALVRRGERVGEDRLNHASLIDALRLAGAKSLRYPHADVSQLSSRCAQLDASLAMVVTDGVFSMDGDVAPLNELACLADRSGAILVVDDAHGLGVLGENGRGSISASGCADRQVPVLVGTLGKAFGVFGAFVAGSKCLIETLMQAARTYIYTTALPPGVATAAYQAVLIAQQESWRRERVIAMARRFRLGAEQLGLPVGGNRQITTPIQPIIVGSAQNALSWSSELEQAGFRVAAIRPPTVPEGTSRLRISFTAQHSEDDVDQLLEVLARTMQRHPVAD